ncbi:MAG: hypothetical protein H6811_05985 [Phycisphaeraceae bacterium]|nr:hypothetical protein [Phycisphaeraceae bacterium]
MFLRNHRLAEPATLLADPGDQVYDNTLYRGNRPRADVTGSTTGGDFHPHAGRGRPNGTLDSDDSTYWSGLSAQPAMGRKKLSSDTNASDLRNRRSLAGYEWDPAVKKYHVRNRVLDPEIGRWTRRDPLGYVDGASLYNYVNALCLLASDPMGLQCTARNCRSDDQNSPTFNDLCKFLCSRPIRDPDPDAPPPPEFAGVTYCNKDCEPVCCVCENVLRNKYPADETAQNIVIDCTHCHESIHVAGGCPRPSSPRSKGCAEAAAYLAELLCLASESHRCSTSPDPQKCRSSLEQRQAVVWRALLQALRLCAGPKDDIEGGPGEDEGSGNDDTTGGPNHDGCWRIA